MYSLFYRHYKELSFVKHILINTKNIRWINIKQNTLKGTKQGQHYYKTGGRQTTRTKTFLTEILCSDLDDRSGLELWEPAYLVIEHPDPTGVVDLLMNLKNKKIFLIICIKINKMNDILIGILLWYDKKKYLNVNLSLILK